MERNTSKSNQKALFDVIIVKIHSSNKHQQLLKLGSDSELKNWIFT